jgi:Flp pilus assembly protein CpaB
MGRIIVLILGLATIAFAAKYMLAGTIVHDPARPTQPKRQLDNVRVRAKQLEREQQKSADDLARKIDGQ